MSIRPIRNPLAGERVIGLSPASADEATTVWRRRPNLFPGRALTAAALVQRQAWGQGHLALRGQDWVAGVVDGLGVDFAIADDDSTGPAAVQLRIAAGRALAVSGEDLVLTRPLECRLADVPVVAPPGFFIDGSGVEDGDETAPPSLRERSIGPALGALEAAAAAALPDLGLLLLQPVSVDVAELDALDPCERSACDEGTITDAAAFEDWRIGDAVRLLWYVWPGEWRGRPAVPALQMRNARAWQVFEAEAALGEGETLPWEPWGLPLALVALDAARQPLWLDRAGVARQGGRGREGRLQRAGAGRFTTQPRLPSLWEAPFEQLAEQIASAGEPAPPAGELADAFGRRLPPVGLLPKDAFDAATRRSEFFPPGFDLDAAPVPVEQLDLAVRASAGLAPLRLDAAESVRLLVPVPLQSWEPRLLQTELVDPLFPATLQRYLLDRARALGMRQGLRWRGAMLTHALSGQTPAVPPFKDDAQALERESLSPWGPPPPGGGHRSALLGGLHEHYFDGATTPFAVAAGESLFAWVCLDPEHPPATLMLQWHRYGGGWEQRAFWGADLIPLGSPAGSAAHYRAGDLPTAGAWVMLSVPAAVLGLEGAAVDGMAFTLHDGRAAYGLAGARNGGTWRKWFCNYLPAGARVQGNEAWELLTANDLWVPFEPQDGVVPSLPELQTSTGGDPFGGEAAAAALAVPGGGFNILYPPAVGWRGHVLNYSLLGNAAPSVARGGPETLAVWVYLDELAPPRSLWMAVVVFGLNNEGGLAGSQFTISYWGENRLPELAVASPGFRSLEPQTRRAGALPPAGVWTLLQLPLPDGASLPASATRMRLMTLLPMAFGGNLAFSDVQITTPGANGAAPTVQRIWPLSVNAAGEPQPPHLPYLNAKLTLQNNLGVLTPTPSSRIGTVRVYRDLVADPLLQKLSAHEQSQLLLRGLQGFADYLRRRIDRADDITDFGFAHMQVDLHRLRQMMMSTTDAARLAVSPALAAIAKGDSALVVQGQIKDYLATVRAGAQQAVAAPAPAGVGDTAGAFGAFAAGAAAGAAASAGSSAVKSVVGTQARLITPPRAAKAIVYAAPVLGLSELRTAAIADRLRSPPSTEARDYALSNRHRTVQSLLQLLEDFLAEDSGAVPALLEGFEIRGLSGDPFVAGTDNGLRALTEFRGNAALLAQLLLPPATNNGTVDEAVLFTQTVSLSDSTVAVLRALEGRLTVYRDVLERCDSALAQLRDDIATNLERVASVEDALAEARHDVSVARALLAEEQDRVAAINQRRSQVLAEEVKFIAYVRPREADSLRATPTHAVDPGLLEAPVPACLREHPEVPEELQDILQVIGEAPAPWFVRLPTLLGRLDKSDHLVRLVQGAQRRAAGGLALPAVKATLAAGAAGSKLGISLARIADRQVAALAPRLAAVQAVDLTRLASASWQGIRQQVEQVVSFADLAEGGHGRADVARAAATELDQIRSIVTCLHAEFSAVPPALRLLWADTLSEFDEAPNLRNLASLPRFAELAYVDRRQMQGYVDWLFDQIEPGQPQAVALLDDVVRMTLLLASHAPIDRIVGGRLAKPVTGVSTGIRLPLAVLDSAQLRVGMQALMYRNDTLVARAVVEDLGHGEVSARVVHTRAERVDLGDDVRVHFDHAPLVSLQAAAARRTLFRR
ncbi:MAG: hypothetical protein JNL87_09610 [Burkholderiaceae bacterium]|nr:hypothetical protein [Burkholderiaceae bacterium]